MAGILVAEPHEVNVEARRRSRRDGRLGSPAQRSGRLLPRNLSPQKRFREGHGFSRAAERCKRCVL